jgi:hypothetical protein
MPDGSKIGVAAAAVRLGVGVYQAYWAADRVGYRYEDIKRLLFPPKPKPSARVAELDHNLVYTLGSYSKGQDDHREILMQLLGLDGDDEEEFWRRFPDA